MYGHKSNPDIYLTASTRDTDNKTVVKQLPRPNETRNRVAESRSDTSRSESDSSFHFITAHELRHRFGLGHGSEIHLTAHERLTPEALSLVREKGIRVLLVEQNGDMSLVTSHGELQKVSPLKTIPSSVHGFRCAFCGSQITEKPEDWTHLDDTTMVPKTHPRIQVRGKIDSMIASVILAQTEFDKEKRLAPELGAWLADLRSWLGSILKAEVTGEPLPQLSMGEMNFNAIHEISHNPSRYLGYAHMVPDAMYGRNVAILNRLRAEVREVELSMAGLTENRRPDLVLALNRMSSAFYVLMLYTHICECNNGSSAGVRLKNASST